MEYLASLRERHQVLHKQQKSLAKDEPTTGSVVLVADEGPRGTWKLGIITELCQSRDHEIRVAKVRTPNGNVLTRTLDHLYPLEIQHDLEMEKKKTNEYQINKEEPRRSLRKRQTTTPNFT
jgi:hypothetical protein